MYVHCKKCRVILNFPSLSQFQLALFIETEATMGGLKQPKIFCSVEKVFQLVYYAELFLL